MLRMRTRGKTEGIATVMTVSLIKSVQVSSNARTRDATRIVTLENDLPSPQRQSRAIDRLPGASTCTL